MTRSPTGSSRTWSGRSAWPSSSPQLPVSVYVGTLEGDSRATALQLHGALGDEAAETVLIAVDPGARRVEVVTGPSVRRRLDDRAAGLAAMTMTSAFQAGDLSGGIASGVLALAEHAHAPAACTPTPPSAATGPAGRPRKRGRHDLGAVYTPRQTR